jgi:hypothetical protein
MHKLICFLGRPTTALWGIVALVILYPLSVGPAAWLIWHVKLPSWLGVVFGHVYSPLMWLDRRFPHAMEIVNNYISLWVDYKNMRRPPATAVPDYHEPTLAVSIAGTIVAALLLFNIVRFVQRRTASLGRDA